MTANDSDVSDGDILTGSQVVRVYGESLTSPFVTLTFGDVEYTPLAQGEGYIEFILGDNGVAIISVDGSRFMSFEVEGNVVPDDLTANKAMWMIDSNSSESSDPNRYNYESIAGNCINYDHKTTAESRFVLRLNFKEELGQYSDYNFSNCTPNTWSYYNLGLRTNMLVVDVNQPAYVTYKGFIVAVFNYTTE